MTGPLYDAVAAYLRDRDLELDEDPDSDTVSFPVSLPDAAWQVYVWAREDTSQLLVHSVPPYEVPVGSGLISEAEFREKKAALESGKELPVNEFGMLA